MHPTTRAVNQPKLSFAFIDPDHFSSVSLILNEALFNLVYALGTIFNIVSSVFPFRLMGFGTHKSLLKSTRDTCSALCYFPKYCYFWFQCTCLGYWTAIFVLFPKPADRLRLWLSIRGIVYYVNDPQAKVPALQLSAAVSFSKPFTQHTRQLNISLVTHVLPQYNILTAPQTYRFSSLRWQVGNFESSGRTTSLSRKSYFLCFFWESESIRSAQQAATLW